MQPRNTYFIFRNNVKGNNNSKDGKEGVLTIFPLICTISLQLTGETQQKKCLWKYYKGKNMYNIPSFKFQFILILLYLSDDSRALKVGV